MKHNKKIIISSFLTIAIPVSLITTSSNIISSNNFNNIDLYNNDLIEQNLNQKSFDNNVSFNTREFSITTDANDVWYYNKNSGEGEKKYVDPLYRGIKMMDVLNEYIIGNDKDYGYKANINFSINSSTNNMNWKHKCESSTVVDSFFGLFYSLKFYERTDSDQSGRKDNPFAFEKNKTKINFNEIIDRTKEINYGRVKIKSSSNSDCSMITVKNSVRWNTATDELLIYGNYILQAYEWDASNSWADSESNLLFRKKEEKLSFNVVMPYTNNDLNTFRESFNQTLAKPIRINNASNPIIFDYKNQNNMNSINENEQLVENEFNRRLNIFIDQNHDLLNKFGSVVYFNNQTKKWEINRNNVEIILDIPNSVRGKTGNQICNVRFKLKNNRRFNFGGDIGIKNEYSIPIKIVINLDPNLNFEIEQNIQIIPYVSASDNNDYYNYETNLDISLGGNEPNPLMIDKFSININPQNEVGKYALIDNQKLPIISKVGTIITLNVQIKIDDLIINKPLKFERLYTNGTLYSSIEISNDDYKDSDLKFVDNELTFGIKMINDQIIIFNNEPYKLTYKNDNVDKTKKHNVSLELTDANATIPSEQTTKPSKWVQIEDGSFDEEKNLKYVGTYETYDPFIFKFIAMKIDLRDPITGEHIGYASKYKPFIRKGKFNNSSNVIALENNSDETIFPKPEFDDENAIYEANLGNYVMANKNPNENFEFQIVIKEFDPSSNAANIDDRYTQDRWIIGISMNLLSSEANFVMSGYKDNKLIQEENKQKFFNKESPYYRGEYVDEKTGMYKPKLVWVNAFPPESFLYDPLDEFGNNIINPLNPSEEEIKKAKYDIGYIAELNATGFSSNDYTSLPTFGGYETNFDTNIFTPTGLMPYSEFYKYNNNDIEPKVVKVPLSQSGLQTVKSDNDFRQIVLKRPNSNNYLYQFVKISNSSKEIIDHPDIISLYGDLKGLDGKPLFVDFWETYQGKHLMNYLLNEAKVIDNEQKVKELSYNDIMQYWNIYVNDPKHYNLNQDLNYNGLKDIKNLQKYFEVIITCSGDFETLRKIVIQQITSQLQTILIQNGYIDENKQLQYGIDFNIDEDNLIFEKNISKLIDNYSVPLLDAKTVDFKISMIDSAFEKSLIKPTGSITISIFNNKDSNKIIDLSMYNASKLSINTSNDYFKQSTDLVKMIKEIILDSINNDLKRIIDQSNLDLGIEYIPKLNEDYQLNFYTEYYDENNTLQKYYYHSIDEAIKDCLLYQTDKNVFYNKLLVDIKAIFNNEHHLMTKQLTKVIVNDSSQESAIIDNQPFDLSSIKAHDIQINTKNIDFPSKLSKADVIWKLMIDRSYSDIYYYAKKWIQVNKIDLKIGIDFDIRLIKSFDENNIPIYYETNSIDDILNIINEVLINNIENDPKFNRDLYFEVYGLNGSLLENKFIKKVNNSYLNPTIGNDDLGDVYIDYNDKNNGYQNGDKLDLANDNANDSGFDWWWVVTPVTVFILLVIILFIIYKVRKNRRIR